MANRKSLEEIIPGGRRRSRYPMHKLKRVERPTTKIMESEVKRSDPGENGFSRARKGELGPAAQREMMRFVPKYPIGASLARLTTALSDYHDGEIARQRAPIPEDPELLSEHIKSLGYFLRADIVGICELPQYAVYRTDVRGEPVNLDHKYAIVIAVDQDYETMAGSTGDDWISGAQSFIGYSNSSLISCMIADYIRRLGYPARAHNATGYQVVVPPLLLLAGIGEMSRAGIVLNPFMGMRFKAAVVTTDLPLRPDKPVDFGLQAFCEACKKCAVECHSGAITEDGKEFYNGYESWRFNADQCAKYRVINPHGSACGRCLKVCPFNKPKGRAHDMVRWMIHRVPFLDGVIARMDDIWGYGKQEEKYKWWFDLEEVDGTLQAPKRPGPGSTD